MSLSFNFLICKMELITTIYIIGQLWEFNVKTSTQQFKHCFIAPYSEEILMTHAHHYQHHYGSNIVTVFIFGAPYTLL